MGPTRPGAQPAGLADAFRAAFSAHPAGVAIVTASGPNGPAGITASSVISVSAEPPVLAVSITRGTESGAALLAGETLAVHLLTTANRRLAELFARPGSHRFGFDMDWYSAPTGEPIIRGVGTVLRCKPLDRMPAGTGVVLAAQVLQVLDGGSFAPALVYQRRMYYALDAWSTLRPRS
ncbi:flavin reductase [Arthrobacter sp. CAU 1506]|uniref:flavin reductase family protein n=1 Tax=Arthrobacter sp. CAU 1506 TaxID=2560052 RepID=UPI0010AD639E|nr:flavin reductase family protein [Arthrobacter sp. CAU 1506]TJY68977.1 flavin reductase [Arthrobacter sp. CAU 1506]